MGAGCSRNAHNQARNPTADTTSPVTESVQSPSPPPGNHLVDEDGVHDISTEVCEFSPSQHPSPAKVPTPSQNRDQGWVTSMEGSPDGIRNAASTPVLDLDRDQRHDDWFMAQGRGAAWQGSRQAFESSPTHDGTSTGSPPKKTRMDPALRRGFMAFEARDEAAMAVEELDTILPGHSLADGARRESPRYDRPTCVPRKGSKPKNIEWNALGHPTSSLPGGLGSPTVPPTDLGGAFERASRKPLRLEPLAVGVRTKKLTPIGGSIIGAPPMRCPLGSLNNTPRDLYG